MRILVGVVVSGCNDVCGDEGEEVNEDVSRAHARRVCDGDPTASKGEVVR